MSNFDLKVARKYAALYASAQARNKEFDLSLTSVANILRAKRCYYTGKPLNDLNRSVDRIDNTKGYVKGNICCCLIEINMAKDQISVEDIIKMGKKLQKRVNKI